MSKLIDTVVKHKLFNSFSNTLLLSLYLYFLYNHIVAIRSSVITPVTMIFVAMESIVIVLLLTRSDPKERTTSTFAWGVAFCGTLIPLLLSPSGETLSATFGNTFLFVGGLLAIGSYLSLNLSFGISPALRKVKTSGLYSIVRHPMYFSYYVLFLGYIASSFSIYNLMIFFFLILFLILRIICEEELLMKSPDYQEYAKKVRYRLIPFIY